MRKGVLLSLLLLLLLSGDGNGSIPKIPPGPPSVKCAVSNWSAWTNCTCALKIQTRTRFKYGIEADSKTCNFVTLETRPCCCPTDCVMSTWGNWASCSKTCGPGIRKKYRSTITGASCGGSCSNNWTSEACTMKTCCDCNYNKWSTWSPTCSCGMKIRQFRNRAVSRNPVCGVEACLDLGSSRWHTCPCCRHDCQWTWGNWGQCSNNCGNGTQTRAVVVNVAPDCGGSSCPSSQRPCTNYVNKDCQMSAWSSYGNCLPSNGRCGPGTKYRYRSITTAAVCKGKCFSKDDPAPCSTGCCPVNCVMNSWGKWGSCSVNCGTGTMSRKRAISTPPSCNGKPCPADSQSSSCIRSVPRNCVMGNWGPWTACPIQCIAGMRKRSRSVLTLPACGGTACPSKTVAENCNSSLANKDCQVGAWGNWSSCTAKCAIGKSFRSRTVIQKPECRGKPCLLISESKLCGLAKGGCQHKCSQGICSCNNGYLLNSDGKTCRPRDCGQPSLKYCPPGNIWQYPTTCKYPTIKCTGTTYLQTCNLVCPSGYELKNGPAQDKITCLDTGAWTPYGNSYCSRINDPPTKIFLSNTYVNENRKAGTVVGLFTTSDPNPTDTHTYSLLYTSSRNLLLKSNALVINFSPDYESIPNSFKITVKSTDNKGLSTTATFIIKVRDVNEKPTSVSISKAEIKENSPKGTKIGSLSTSDQDSGQSHSYSLLVNPGSRFSISGNTLQVAVSNVLCLAQGGSLCSLNYEAQSSFSVTVRSQDNGSPVQYKDQVFTIKLTDVNDRPRTFRLSGYKMAETASVDFVIGYLSASDEDKGQSLTYSLSNDAGGRFAVKQGNRVVRKVASGIDYETTTGYKITAVAKDNGRPSLSISQQFTIEILDVNEAPVSITFTSAGGQVKFTPNNSAVRENSVRDTTVGTLEAYDADANQKLIFRLDDSAGGRFALKTTAQTCTSVNVKNLKTKCTVPVVVKGVLNYEANSVHSIVVRATDEKKLFKVARFSIKIINVNDRPRDIIFSGGAKVTAKENQNNAVLGSFKTADDDLSNVHTYTLTNSAGGRFLIKGANLMTSSSANLDFESKSQYTIVVRSTDSGSPPLNVEESFTVQVLDENETPTFVTLSANGVSENSASGTLVGLLSATDPDNAKTIRQTITYTLRDSAGGRFKITGSSVKVAVSNVRCLAFGGAECKINYETNRGHKIVVRATDNGSPPKERDFTLTINVIDVNDMPRGLDISNFKVKENAPVNTVVGTFTATDEDTRQTLSYSLTDDDKGQFKVLGNQLLKAKSSDYETKQSHSISVNVTDNGKPQKSMTKRFTIEVLDVKEAPVSMNFKDIGGQLKFAVNSPRVKENSPQKTVVGTIEATDPDKGELKFSLDDSASGLFKLKGIAVCSSVNGVPTKTVCTANVIVAGALDYEAGQKHSIIVRVTDGTGLFKTAQFSVGVVNVNDPPKDIQLAGGLPDAAENKNGVVVGGLVTIDDDTFQTHTYKLIINPGGRFVVVGSEIRVSQSANLDYESASQFTISVQSTDNGSPALSLVKSFVIKVTDVNERPSSVRLSSNVVPENSNTNTMVGKLSTIDPDNSRTSRQTFTYLLLDDASGRFKLDGNSIKVAASNVRCLALGGTACVLNFEKRKQYSIIVRSTDSGSPALAINYTLIIGVTDVNDKPRSLSLSNNKVYEHKNAGTVVGVFSVSDEDASQKITYSLTNSAGGKFKIVGNQLQKATSADYETAKAHSISVLAKDNGSPSMSISRTFTIEVLNVNEAPIGINITDQNGQLKFNKNQPRVQENSPVGTTVGEVVGLDHDENEKLTFRLDDNAGGKFSLGNAVCKSYTAQPGIKTMCVTSLKVSGSLNYEGSSKHYITVRLTDTKGSFATRRVNIAIVDVNDRPRAITFSGGIQPLVKENRNNVAIGSFTTSDDDPSHVHKYTLVKSAGGKFVISGATLKTSTTANLNYELQSQYVIVVRSTDSGSPPLSVEKAFTVQVADVNEAPTSATLTANKVKENSPIGTVIGSLTATDPDNVKTTRQTFTYVLLDNAVGRFKIDGSTLKVAVSNKRCLAIGGIECKINYEAAKSYKLVVRATDSGNPPLQKDFTVTVYVTDENDQPRNLGIDNFKIKENSAVNSLIGTLSATDEDSGTILSYQLTKNDNGQFKLSGNKLLKAKPADYETKTSHSVSVAVTDNGNPSKSMTKNFTIEVLNENDPPVTIHFKDTGGQLSFPDDSPRVNENSPLKTVVGLVEAFDEDPSQTLALSMDDDSGGLFEIATGSAVKCSSTKSIPKANTVCTAQVTVAGAIDFEGTGKHSIIIRATDKGGLFKAINFTVTVVNLNDKPKDIQLAGGSPQVLENKNNAVVGSLVTIDDDSAQTYKYVLLDDAGGRFIIDGSTVKVSKSANLDFETDTQHTIVVKSTDSGSPPLSVERKFVIKVLDLNEKPVVVSLDKNLVLENSGRNTVIGTLSTSDPDNSRLKRQTFTYKLLDGASGRFLVDGNVVKVAASNVKCLAIGGKECLLNFETQKQHTILVRATDSGSPTLSVDQTITIKVTDANDRPRALSLSANKIFENQTKGDVVGTLGVNDEDIAQTVSYSLTDDDNGRFYILGNELRKAVSADYETAKSHSVTVLAEDNGKPVLSISKTFTIEVLNVNEAPARINITDEGGQQTFNTDKPAVEEKSAIGTVIGKVVALDDDSNEKLIFRLDDDAGGTFSLGATSCKADQQGVKTICWTYLKVKGDVDYEGNSKLYIDIRVTDSKGLFFTRRLIIAVIDINERPEDIAFSGGVQPAIKENENDAILGTFRTTDDDPANVHTYSLADSAGGKFVIKGSTLKTSPSANLNYELQSQYKIVVRSTDSGLPPLFVEKTFTVKVLDVNEAPTLATLKPKLVPENSDKGTVIGSLSATDPDNLKTNRQTVTFTLIDSAEGRFSIDKGTVKVALSNSRCLLLGGAECKIDFEVATFHTIVVKATDNGSPPLQTTFSLTISVKNINDQPRNLRIDNYRVKENASINSSVGNLSASDEDSNQVLSYRLTDNDNGRFKLKENQLLKAKSTDYETKTSHRVTVEVSDNGSPNKKRMVKTFTIEILNVNEAPVSIQFKDTGGAMKFSDNAPEVKENSLIGTTIGTLEAGDEDSGQLLSFSLDNDDGGLFAIDKSSNVVCKVAILPKVKTLCSVKVTVAGKFDYKKIGQHSIVVRVTDKGGLFKVGKFTVIVRNVNDPPSAIQLASGFPKIAENKNGAVVGGLVTTDDETSQKHSYALDDDAGGRFTLDGDTIKVSASANLDYETASKHTITVTSTDTGTPPLSLTKDFVIEVLDVNEQPTAVKINNNAVPENSGMDTLVGALSTVDPDNSHASRQTFTYKLIGDASGRFKLDGSFIKVAASNVRCLANGGKDCLLNYEMAKTHNIVVRATDSGSPALSVDYTLTIQLKDVNDRPRNLDLSDDKIFENENIGTTVGILTATDDDTLQKITFLLTDDDNGRFTVVGNKLQKAKATDYETATSHTVTVLAKDNGNPALSISKTFTIEVLDVNEAPIRINITDESGQMKFSQDSPRVKENSPVGTVIGKVIGLDHDSNDRLTFRLDDSASGRFTLGKTTCKAYTDKPGINLICSTTLNVGGNLNYEDNVYHYVTIRTTDPKGKYFTRRFKVAVVDVNDRPRMINFANGLQPSIKENENGAALGSFTTVDDDPAHVHKYTLSNSAGGKFIIKGATLMTSSKANLNYEQQSQYVIVVRSTDSGSPSLFFEKSFTVQVLDVNEKPSAVKLMSNTVAENSDNGTVVGRLSATDPDNQKTAHQTVTYTLLDNGGGRFRIDGDVVKVAASNTRCLQFGGNACKLNYEVARSHGVVVRATDNGSPPLQRNFNLIINVTDANDQPRNLDIDDFKVNETGKFVGTFSATDEDSGRILSYKLTQDDNGLFVLKGMQLWLTKWTDYETQKSHTISATVTDNGSPHKSMTKNFTIEVLNENEPPVTVHFKDAGGQLSFADGSPRIKENSALGTIVGTVEGHDEDSGQTLVFSMDDDSGGLFKLTKSAVCVLTNSIPGVKTVCTAKIGLSGSLNFEGNTNHSIIIRVTDKGQLFKVTRFTVTVVNVNDKATDIFLSSSDVLENQKGAFIGTLSTIDDEEDTQTYTYSLTNDAGSLFVIDGNKLRVSPDRSLDYESGSQHTIEVKSTDSGTPALSFSKTFVVEVLDINEKPTVVSLDKNSVPENSGINTVIGLLSTSDPDNSHEIKQTFAYKIIDGASGRFWIDGNVVKVALSNVKCLAIGGKECLLNYEVQNNHSILVRAIDNGSPPMSVDQTLSIKVTDANDKPRALSLSANKVFENEATGTVVGILGVKEEDSAQKISYSLKDDDDGKFVVVENELRKAVSADYETAKSHTVTVLAKDNGNPVMSISKVFTIEVLNVNEAPIQINITDEKGQLKYSKDSPMVEENSPVGTIVGKVTTLDYDANETLKMRLDDDSDGKFSLGTVSCAAVTDQPGINTMCWAQLKVKGILNYEGDARHYINIRAIDSKGLFFTRRIVINIVDVNDVPEGILFSDGIQPKVLENQNNAVLGTFTTTDDDPANVHKYSLIDSAGGRFVIIGGTLRTSSSANLNYEVQSKYTITVRSTDSGSPPLYVEKSFTVQVLDVNEEPTGVTLKSNTVPENSAKGTPVGSLVTKDPDNEKTLRQNFTYTLLDDAEGRFELDNGVVKVALSNDRCLLVGGLECKIDFETSSSHRIVVQTKDNGNPPMQRDFAVIVLISDVNDKPRNLQIDKFRVKENDAKGTPVGIFSATEEDAGQVLSYHLTDSDNGQFKLKGNQLVKNKSADYETKTSHNITVTVTDDGKPQLSMTKTFVIEVLNVNEPPVTIHFKDMGGAVNFPVDHPVANENSNLKTVVGTVEGGDEDGAEILFFSLDDDSNGLFTIATGDHVKCIPTKAISGVKTLCTAEVTVAGKLNFERIGGHRIIVRAKDKAGLFKVANFTVTVRDVNDKPTEIKLADGFPQVKENENGAVVGGLVTIDDDIAQNHVYFLVNDAGGRFVVNGTEIQVAMSANLDYESASEHSNVIQSTDSGSPSKSVTKTIVIKVLDVNELPTSVNIDSSLVPENSGTDTKIGNLSTTDPDNSHKEKQTFIYSLVDSASGRFELEDGVIKVAASNLRCLAEGGDKCVLNYEESKHYNIIVQVTDNGSPPLSINYTLTLQLTDVNDRPRYLELSNDKVFENDNVGTVVGTLSATDEDKTQTLTFELRSDNGRMFKIVGRQLQKAMPADYETSKVHFVTVVARDDGNPSLEIVKNFTIEVLNVGESPFKLNITDDVGQLSFTDDQPRVEENSPAGTLIGKIIAFDYDESDRLSFNLDGNDVDDKVALGNVSCMSLTSMPGVNTMCWTLLSLADDLNYEDSSSFDVNVRVSDATGLFMTRQFTVEVVDVNDVPHDIKLVGNIVDENLNDTHFGIFATEDQDPTHNHTYELIDNAGGRFVVKGSGLWTSSNASLNFEKKSIYQVTVRSTDNGVPPMYIEEKFLITIRDVNEAPSLMALSNTTISENSPPRVGIGFISVIDPDNTGPAGDWQTHNCSTLDDADGRFIVESNFLKTSGVSLNYEMNSSWVVVLRCEDSGNPSLYKDEEFVITVLDVNERPTTIYMIQGGWVKENQPASQIVAKFATTDPDNQVHNVQMFKYFLESSSADFPFEIVGDELKTTRTLDFEKASSWIVVVRSTDTGDLSVTRTFLVNVNDTNDPPVGLQLVGSSSVPENAVGGTYVGHFYEEDEDGGDTHTFKILSIYSERPTETGPFVLNSTTGVLTVAEGAVLDYETLRHYTIEVVTTDSGNPPLSFTGTVVVNITDVNERPTNISLDQSEVIENSYNGTVVGTLMVEDNNEKQKHSCIVLDSPNEPFKVINNTILVVAGSLNYEQEDYHYVNIRCSDSGTPPQFLDKLFVIRVLNVNEAPTLVGITSYAVKENNEVGSLVGEITCLDPDNEDGWSQNVTYMLEDVNGIMAPFTINGTELFTAAVFDFEIRSLYSFNLSAVDTGTPVKTSTVTITIKIQDVNDKPTDVTLKSKGVKENSPGGTEIGMLTTQDEDRGQNYTYSIVSIGSITALFYVNGNKVMIASGAKLNYEEENSYVVIMRTTDNGSPPLSYEDNVVIKVLNVNEPPNEITSYYHDEIFENSPAGTFVANLTVKDPDFNQTHTCRLLNGSEYFSIMNSSSPFLFTADHAHIDYEKDSFIRVLIRCTDDGNPPLSLEHSFDVDVIDVNEPVTQIILKPALPSLPEDLAVGSVIATISSVDEDVGQTHVFNLSGFLATAFKINNLDRTLIVAQPIQFDFERLTDPKINVTIFVTDDGNPPMNFSQTFFFNVTNVNEPPTNVRLKDNQGSISENAKIGDVVGILTSINPEGHGPIDYRLLSVNGVENSTEFYLVNRSSEIAIILNRTLDYDGVSSFSLGIVALDHDSPPASSLTTLVIEVDRVDPCAIGLGGCHANATCFRTNKTTGECECDAGFDGDGTNCVKIDYCATTIIDVDSLRKSGVTYPVKVCNYGTCVNGVFNYSCSCDAGYVEPYCSEEVDECASNPCGVGGTCTDFVNGFTCSCLHGYTGAFCEVNEDDCRLSPCGHGTCIDGVADFTCVCQPGYTGDVCSFSTTACTDGNDLCPGTHCIPKDTSFDGPDVICVPDKDVVILPFNDTDDNFLNQWERFLKDNLNITSSDLSGGVNSTGSQLYSVYILSTHVDPEGDTFVHFVVLLNNEAVPTTSVLIGLRDLCNNGKAVSKLGEKMPCSVIPTESPTPPQTLPVKISWKSGSSGLWPVVVAVLCIALLLLTIMSTIFYFRKRQMKRLKSEYAEHVTPHVYDDGLGSGDLIRNPIYDSDMALFIGANVRDRMSGIRNPLFGFDDTDDSEMFTVTNLTYEEPDRVICENPLYEMSAEDGEMDNPIYDSSHGYTGNERIYEEPKDSGFG